MILPRWPTSLTEVYEAQAFLLGETIALNINIDIKLFACNIKWSRFKASPYEHEGVAHHMNIWIVS